MIDIGFWQCKGTDVICNCKRQMIYVDIQVGEVCSCYSAASGKSLRYSLAEVLGIYLGCSFFLHPYFVRLWRFVHLWRCFFILGPMVIRRVDQTPTFHCFPMERCQQRSPEIHFSSFEFQSFFGASYYLCSHISFFSYFPVTKRIVSFALSHALYLVLFSLQRLKFRWYQTTRRSQTRDCKKSS